MDKETPSEKSAVDAERRAVELMEAAAYSRDGGSRLWRLEWAQAFRRLADLAKKRDEPSPH